MASAKLEILGCRVEVKCDAPGTTAALETAFGPLASDHRAADISYHVFQEDSSQAVHLVRTGGDRVVIEDAGHFLRALDQDLRCELQKLRPDLFFVHSGVLCLEDRALMLVGHPGSGKSTTCWGLSHYGLAFLSDEMAPIDLASLSVLPYVRALHLKEDPPGAYPLPAESLKTAGSIHVSLEALPGGIHRQPAPLNAIFFLHGSPGASEPCLRSVGAAEAASRLYANSLNALAHPADGLDAAVKIADGVAAFALTPGPLGDTCELIRTSVEELNSA